MAAPADLEALVREELREPVAALVRKLVPELVAEELNGHAPAVTVAAAEPEGAEESPRPRSVERMRGETSEGLRTCSACQAAKPAGEFSPGHSVCKACRRVQERDRARRKRAAEASDPEG